MKPETITIPAAVGGQGGVSVAHVTGKYFLCTATTGTVSVVTSYGDQYDFSASGFGFGNDVSPTFGKLTFYNNGGAPVTITYYASNEPIKVSDVNVQSSITVTTQLTNTLAGCAPSSLTDQVQIAVNANQQYKFNGNSIPFRKITIIAAQNFGGLGADPTPNVGKVYIGVSANHQPITLNPGDIYVFEAPTGASYNLNQFYLSAANAGDGILFIYS